MPSLLRLERLQKPFRIRISLFLSYSFGIEMITTFIHTRSSLENLTRLDKIYNSFQTKPEQKPYPFGSGRHIPIWLIWGSTLWVLNEAKNIKILCEEICRSRRMPNNNSLRDRHYPAQHTKAEFNNCFITHPKYFYS